MKEFLSKVKKFVSTKTFVLVASLVGLFLITVGISVLIFSFVLGKNKTVSPSTGKTSSGKSKINLNLPKTEMCPINGQMFTKNEKNVWETRRPIAAMVENHADSRPPSGISKADVVYEAVAEGGITRFLGIFYCGVSVGEVNIAPVRSARIYFVNIASEYNTPIFMHVGGANNYSGSGDTAKQVRALEFLETIGWRFPKGNDFDTTYDSGFPVFWRNYERLDHEVATEHTMMASIDAAYEEAAKRGFTSENKKGVAWSKGFTPWKFVEGKANQAPQASDISFSFWANKPDYDVEWKYDSAANLYKRFNGGKAHMDLEFETQLSASNVVIFFAKEVGPVDKNLHMFYTTTGTGKALVFQNGGVIEGTWVKPDKDTRTKFLDTNGKEISLVKGQTWIEVVPAGNTVKY